MPQVSSLLFEEGVIACLRNQNENIAQRNHVVDLVLHHITFLGSSLFPCGATHTFCGRDAGDCS